MPSRRTVAVLFALSWLAHACRPGWSQIVVEPRYDVGEPIVVECQAKSPEGGMIAYKWRGDAKFRRIGDGARAHVWAKPGEHSIECITATCLCERSIVAKNGEPSPPPAPPTIKVYRAKFVVGDPVPPTPPKPLNELVDAETAKKLATWLRAFATDTVLTRFDSGEACRAALSDQGQAYKLADNAAWPVIVQRVAKVAVDGPLDRLKVADELRKIAEELSAAPEPGPEPTPPGPKAEKLWLVAISRTEDRTVAQAALFTSPTVRSALGAHKLLSLDRDQAEARKYDKYAGQIPCVVVMDQATNKVFGVEIVPPVVDDAWLVGVAAKYAKGAP